MPKNTATSLEKSAALEAIRAEFKGTDGDTQRARLLAALETLRKVSTYEARRELDIYYPPARIKELRDDGYKIDTRWQVVTTEAGIDHRVGLYVLMQGGAYEKA
jgi:hypothetical protein